MYHNNLLVKGYFPSIADSNIIEISS